jgi:hypothetical protein
MILVTTTAASAAAATALARTTTRFTFEMEAVKHAMKSARAGIVAVSI